MEKIVFRSRVSVWLCALVYALLVAAFWPIVYDFSWSLLLIFLLTMGAVSYGFFGITYTIEGHVLWVRMLGRQRYDIMQLRRVASTRTWIAARLPPRAASSCFLPARAPRSSSRLATRTVSSPASGR